MNDTAAILQAVRDGDMPVVERLLAADPHLVRTRDEYLKTPLHRGRPGGDHILGGRGARLGADYEQREGWPA